VKAANQEWIKMYCPVGWLISLEISILKGCEKAKLNDIKDKEH
jgi:hypothetical protein